MSLGNLQISPPKPRMTLDAFKQTQTTVLSQQRQVKEVMDAFQNASARLGYGTSNLMEGTSYPFNRITLNYILLTSLYRGNWIIRKVVDAIADDMTKNWLDLDTELPPSKIRRFEKDGIEATGTVARLNKAIKLSRLYGGAIALIILKGDDNFERPLEVEEIELDSYKGLLVFDRWSGVSPAASVSTDIDDPINFGLPEFYQITTENSKVFRVHNSRVLRFCGPDLPNWEWQANMRWGASVVESMFEELKKRDNTSYNIASLVFRANIMEMPHKALSSMLSGLGPNGQVQQQFYATLSAITQLMSNQGILITPEDSGGVRTHQYSFGGVNEIYQSFMLDICGATEYPISKLFGRTVSGLGQGNEGDEHNYDGLVEQRQKTELQPQLLKLMPVVAMSVLGKIPKDFNWRFKPVRALTNEAEAELAQKKSQPVIEAFTSGIIGRQTSLKELKQQSGETGLWSNITDEEIEEADNEPMGGEMGMGGDPNDPNADPNAGGEGGEPSATDLLLADEEGGGEGKETVDSIDGDEDAKLTKARVHYQKSDGKDMCGNCSRYRAGACQIVRGFISEDGWCDEYKKAPRQVVDATPWDKNKHPRSGKGSKGGQFTKGHGGGGGGGSGVNGSHQTKMKFQAEPSARHQQIERGVKGKHPEFGTTRARHHLELVEQRVKQMHPEWSTEQRAQHLQERYLPHIKEKAEGEAKQKEEFGDAGMPVARMNSILRKPEAKAKAIAAFGKERKMGSIASTLGLPRNKAARGALRKLLRKAGVYKENGGWEKGGDVDVGFAAKLIGKIDILEKHLSSDKITSSKHLGGGVSKTSVVIFEDGSKGVWKPHSGERPRMRTGVCTDGYQTERETTAWVIAKIIGIEHMVTPCVERQYNGERGAVLEFNTGSKVAAEEDLGRQYDGEKDLRNMAVFDYVIGNTDRHQQNWMVTRDGQLRMIDHGYAFAENNDRGFRNPALSKLKLEAGNEDPSEYFKPYLQKKHQLLSAVKASGLPKKAVRAMEERLDKLALANNWNALGGRI